MSKPGEHKTVQARILAYAQEIGWCHVSRAEAETRRGFDPDAFISATRASFSAPKKTASWTFSSLITAI